MTNHLDTLFQEIVNDLPHADHIGIGIPIGHHLHMLAEAQYEPLRPILRDLLTHVQWYWREDAVCLLGFHYPLTTDTASVDALLTLVAHDPNSFVRLAAAGALSRAPATVLPIIEDAFAHERDQGVRWVLMSTILILNTLPYHSVYQWV